MSTKKSCDQKFSHYMRFRYLYLQLKSIWAMARDFVLIASANSEQRRLRQVCALAQSRQRLGFLQTQRIAVKEDSDPNIRYTAL